ncbi:MAG: hypothetical protein P8Q14_06240 [Vicingaceae bacterium]|nr:hypothetical protein [Vicingaceae bacterium]
MKYFTLIILLIITTRVFSQELIIDDSIVLKKGIYRNFQEFKFNSPSLPLNYEVIPRQFKLFKIDHTTYHINITKEDSKKLGNIFGFCDGIKVYFREEFYMKDLRPKLTSRTEFEEFKFLGLYSSFECIIATDNTYVNHSIDEFVQAININDEKIIIVKQKQLKNILISSPDLLNEYSQLSRKERVKNETIINFLNRYSVRQKKSKGIFRGKTINLTESNLFIKHQLTDTTIDFYHKRILDKFSNNPYFSHVKLKEEFHKNGQRKSSGIIIKHNFCGESPYPYRIGKWVEFDEDGIIIKEISYDICQNRIKK